MWGKLAAKFAGWTATRAATGWMFAIGMAAVASLWFVYDQRGDKIVELERDLARCEGSADQNRIIQQLSEELTQRAQREADESIQRIEDLPNDTCYFLDDPSPRNRVRQPQNDGS